jgi:hypothetical protein
MAFALVGTIGVASQGAVTSAVTPAWGTSENRTAGNLLICFVAVTGVTTQAVTPSGWTQGPSQGANSCSTTIFYKIAAGADAAPTIAAITSGIIAAQLAEFSGNATSSPIDQNSSGGSTSSPVTVNLVTPDVASGELLVMAGADFRSAARTPTDSLTSNNATITAAGNNNGVSSANHYSFGYSLATTSNASGDTAVMTCSVTTSITGLAISAASFKLAPPPLALPDLTQQPLFSPYRP